MRRLILPLLLAATAPAFAQGAPAQLGAHRNAAGQLEQNVGATLLNADGSPLTNLPAADPNNASYTATGNGSTGESATTATASFTNTAQRGVYANCPANTVQTITLTTVGGGALPMTVYDGFQSQPIRVTGYAGNAAGCTIGLLF